MVAKPHTDCDPSFKRRLAWTLWTELVLEYWDVAEVFFKRKLATDTCASYSQADTIYTCVHQPIYCLLVLRVQFWWRMSCLQQWLPATIMVLTRPKRDVAWRWYKVYEVDMFLIKIGCTTDFFGIFGYFSIFKFFFPINAYFFIDFSSFFAQFNPANHLACKMSGL
jgi:hypothetical protein